VLTNAVFPVTDADMCSEVNISTDLQGAVGGVAEVEVTENEKEICPPKVSIVCS